MRLICRIGTGAVAVLSSCVAFAAFETRVPRLDEPVWPELKSEFKAGENFKPRGHQMTTGVPFPGEKFKEAITTSVETVNGTPTFMLNGKPFFAMWGSLDAYSRTVAKTGHAEWGDKDINLFTVNDYHHYDWWLGKDKYDLQYLDWRARFQGCDNSDVYFIWDINLYPPKDWGDENPDELCRDDQGELVKSAPGKGGRCSYSFASRKAREEMKKAITAVIEHIESSPWANRVFGYRINSGTTIEWLGWQPKAGRLTDFSPVAKAAFAEYCKARGFEEVGREVPGYESRFGDFAGQLLFDPYKHIRYVLWNDFLSRQDAETLSDLCEHAKKVLKGRKVVGTYYGYTMTLHDGLGSQYRSHYALEYLLKRKPVDFLCSPQAYRARRLGGPNTDMKPFKALQDRGILSVIEDDSRTHNIWQWDTGTLQTITAEQSRQMLRRNTSICLCRNEPVYFYCICGGMEFNFPEYHLDAFKARAAGELALANGARRQAEVAIVSSEDAIKMQPLNRGTYERTGDLIQSYGPDGKVSTRESAGAVFGWSTFAANYEKWTRGGAPIDYLLAEDLANAKTDYKLYIFINAFLGDKKLVVAAEKLRQRKCTILWVYAPGWAGGGKVGTEPMKRLTGLDFTEIPGGGMAMAKMTDGRLMGAWSFTEPQPKTAAAQKVSPLYSAEGDEVLGRYEDGSAAVVVKRTGAATTIFSGPWCFDMPFVEDVYRRAGVHVYSTTRDPVEANSVFATLHARSPGRKTLKLPKKADVIVDVYAKKVVAEQTDAFSFDMKLHETRLFYYGPEARKLVETAVCGLETVTRRVKPVRFVTNDANRVFVDFGKDAFGWLEVKAPASSTGGVSRIILGEMSMFGNQVRTSCGGSIVAEESRLMIAGGERIYKAETPVNARNANYTAAFPPVRILEKYGVILPFRYAEICELPFVPRPEDLTMVAVNYPMDMTASSFRSDDPRLDRVYDFCKYSILATSFAGLYVDGDRERIPYESDAYINQLGEYAVHADPRLAKASIDYLSKWSTWPIEWRQHFVRMVWAAWMHDGDADFVRKHYELLKNDRLLLGYARATDGLLVTPHEWPANPRAIVDWPEVDRDGFAFRPVNAVVNAFHYRNLLEMADLALAVGKQDESQVFREKAERVRQSFNDVFYNSASGLYRDGVGTNHSSLHANAIALAFGLVPAERIDHVADWCVSRGMACSTYFAHYLLEALFVAGRAEAALKLMTARNDRSWLGMLDAGATMTMESWNREVKPNLDWNHAWSTSPLNAISRFVLGVTPLAPGMKRVRIAPQVGGLKAISGTVPTPNGPVSVQVDGGRLEVSTPVPAVVVWMGREHEVCGKGRFGE